MGPLGEVTLHVGNIRWVLPRTGHQLHRGLSAVGWQHVSDDRPFHGTLLENSEEMKNVHPCLIDFSQTEITFWQKIFRRSSLESIN